MAKCECCGEREAGYQVYQPDEPDVDGAMVANRCGLFGDGKLEDCYDRIRARRAALAGTAWERGEGVAPTNAELAAGAHEHDWGVASQTCNRCDRPRHQCDGTMCTGVRLANAHVVPSLLPDLSGNGHDLIAGAIRCRDCSSPATVSGRCVYCQQQLEYARNRTP